MQEVLSSVINTSRNDSGTITDEQSFVNHVLCTTLCAHRVAHLTLVSPFKSEEIQN